MDLGAGIAAVANGIQITSWLRQVDKNFNSAEFKLKISELADALYDAKEALREAKDKQADDAAEIARLQDSFRKHGELVRGEGNYQYFPQANGKPLGYPICPKCLEVEGRLVEVKQKGVPNMAACPVCSNSYTPVVCYYDEGSPVRDSKEEARLNTEANTAKIREAGKRLA